LWQNGIENRQVIYTNSIIAGCRIEPASSRERATEKPKQRTTVEHTGNLDLASHIGYFTTIFAAADHISPQFIYDSIKAPNGKQHSSNVPYSS
jgi:hypothetical protein